MASSTFASRSAALQTRIGSANALRVVPVRGFRAGRNLSMQVAAAVKFDYNTKVFKKELVKFADTEEYIYRWEYVQILEHNASRNDSTAALIAHCDFRGQNVIKLELHADKIHPLLGHL